MKVKQKSFKEYLKKFKRKRRGIHSKNNKPDKKYRGQGR